VLGNKVWTKNRYTTILGERPISVRTAHPWVYSTGEVIQAQWHNAKEIRKERGRMTVYKMKGKEGQLV
jgi:hypothetical protein